MGHAKRRPTKIRAKVVGGSLSAVFKVYDDVISSVAVDYVGKDVLAIFGEYGLNNGRIIRLFDRPDQFDAPLLCNI